MSVVIGKIIQRISAIYCCGLRDNYYEDHFVAPPPPLRQVGFIERGLAKTRGVLCRRFQNAPHIFAPPEDRNSLASAERFMAHRGYTQAQVTRFRQILNDAIKVELADIPRRTIDYHENYFLGIKVNGHGLTRESPAVIRMRASFEAAVLSESTDSRLLVSPGSAYKLPGDPAARAGFSMFSHRL